MGEEGRRGQVDRHAGQPGHDAGPVSHPPADVQVSVRHVVDRVP